MTRTVQHLDTVGVEVSGFDINKPLTQEIKSELISLWY
jgi:taurine dioxygenase